jgi:hypothetical protein
VHRAQLLGGEAVAVKVQFLARVLAARRPRARAPAAAHSADARRRRPARGLFDEFAVGSPRTRFRTQRASPARSPRTWPAIRRWWSDHPSRAVDAARAGDELSAGDPDRGSRDARAARRASARGARHARALYQTGLRRRPLHADRTPATSS